MLTILSHSLPPSLLFSPSFFSHILGKLRVFPSLNLDFNLWSTADTPDFRQYRSQSRSMCRTPEAGPSPESELGSRVHLIKCQQKKVTPFFSCNQNQSTPGFLKLLTVYLQSEQLSVQQPCYLKVALELRCNSTAIPWMIKCPELKLLETVEQFKTAPV